MNTKAKIDAAINGDYTPGPWEARTSHVGEHYVLARGRVFGGSKTGMSEADARLIAAAPDLAAAYRELQEQLRMYTEGYQGACMACEPVAMENTRLLEENQTLKDILNCEGG
jgi:hypothetical protein